MGYSPSHKGYKCLVTDGRIYISKDAIFNEDKFPYATLLHEPSLITPNLPEPPSTHIVLPSSQTNSNIHVPSNIISLPSLSPPLPFP